MPSERLQNRRIEQGTRLAGPRNERQSLDDHAGSIVGTWRTSYGQNPAPVKPRRFNFFRRIFLVTPSVFDYCLRFETKSLARLELLGWMRNLQTGEKSNAENGSTCPQLQYAGGSPGVTNQYERHGEGLTGITLNSSLAFCQGANNAEGTFTQNSASSVESATSVSENVLAEFNLQALQGLLDSAPDSYYISSTTSPRSLSGGTSVIPLGTGDRTNWLPDVDVYAIGSDEGNVVKFVAKLDTGAEICVMAERVAARIGIHHIDTSDQPDIQGLARQVVKPMGRIDIEFHLRPDPQRYRGSFYVIPDLVVDDRFDAHFSRDVIGQMNLLLLGPKLSGQTMQNKAQVDMNNVIMQVSPRC